MLRVAVPVLVLSACAFDYDGAFADFDGSGGSAGTGLAATTTTAASSKAASAAITTSVASTTASTVDAASSSTGMPCICAPPGTCDGNDVCQCPGTVTIERYPTIGEGTNAGNQGWSNVGAVTVPDAAAATVHLGNNQFSEQLTARGFDFNEIPDDATILGLRVDMDRCRVVQASPVDVKDAFLRLSSGGNVVGAEANLGTWGNCGGAGGSYDFPTAGLSPGLLKSDFGVQLRIRNEATGTADAYLNYVKMTVTFDPTCAP